MAERNNHRSAPPTVDDVTRVTDLASLFQKPGGDSLGAAQPVGYLTGTVMFWNPVTGDNSINVAGAVLSGIPILNRSEIPLIAVGDTVAILIVGGDSKTAAIIGGVTET
jgi:hypothetical protein